MLSNEQKQAIVNEFKGRVAKGGETKRDIILDLGKKHGFGYSTFGTWFAKFNGKAKRKVSTVKAAPAKAIKTTKKQEDEWEGLFDDFIAKRNAANEAKQKLQEYVEQLR